VRWARHVASVGEGRGACRVLVGTSQGKRPFGRYSRRCEDDIKMDLQKWVGASTGLMWLGIGTGGGLL
jgi:hypothetical protein